MIENQYFDDLGAISGNNSALDNLRQTISNVWGFLPGCLHGLWPDDYVRLAQMALGLIDADSLIDKAVLRRSKHKHACVIASMYYRNIDRTLPRSRRAMHWRAIAMFLNDLEEYDKWMTVEVELPQVVQLHDGYESDMKLLKKGNNRVVVCYVCNSVLMCSKITTRTTAHYFVGVKALDKAHILMDFCENFGSVCTAMFDREDYQMPYFSGLGSGKWWQCSFASIIFGLNWMGPIVGPGRERFLGYDFLMRSIGNMGWYLLARIKTEVYSNAYPRMLLAIEGSSMLQGFAPLTGLNDCNWQYSVEQHNERRFDVLPMFHMVSCSVSDMSWVRECRPHVCTRAMYGGHFEEQRLACREVVQSSLWNFDVVDLCVLVQAMMFEVYGVVLIAEAQQAYALDSDADVWSETYRIDTEYGIGLRP
jgi:hypothetical protein